MEEKPTFHSDSARVDIVLEDIIDISDVLPCLSGTTVDDRHFFTIFTNDKSGSFSAKKHHDVIYPTKFEAEAVKAALHGKIIDTREKDVWWIGYRRLDVEALNELEARFRDKQDGEYD